MMEEVRRDNSEQHHGWYGSATMEVLAPLPWRLVGRQGSPKRRGGYRKEIFLSLICSNIQFLV